MVLDVVWWCYVQSYSTVRTWAVWSAVCMPWRVNDGDLQHKCKHTTMECHCFTVSDSGSIWKESSPFWKNSDSDTNISWIIPESTDISEVTHYAINIDGINVYNETNTVNETFLSLSYYVRTCTPHNSSISIFNCCGRAGPPSPNVSTASPQPLVCNDTVCKENTVTGDKFM